MGNRGCLHDQSRRVIRSWARKAWVTCLLEFRGRRRQIMAPGNYTELFFLDEATALAAGHRPCRACRRSQFDRFKQLWVRSNAALFPSDGYSIASIDQLLHAERVDSARRKTTWLADVDSLPTGVMVRLPGDGRPMLLRRDAFYAWSPGGYESTALSTKCYGRVEVLTPHSVVNSIRAGYEPQLHDSVEGVVERRSCR